MYRHSHTYAQSYVPEVLAQIEFCARSELSVHMDCGLEVRVSGYRYRGLGFDSRGYQIF